MFGLFRPVHNQPQPTLRLFLSTSFSPKIYIKSSPKSSRPVRQSPLSPLPQPSTTTSTTTNPTSLISIFNYTYPPFSTETPLNMEGIFAISKPSGPSSAQAVNALKTALNASPYVENSSAWAKLNGVKIKLTTDKRKKQWWYKKHDKKNSIGGVKVGHGGTLDPLASGVIVIGVGEGTKNLTKYLTDCTKVYEATAIFGASTTTYDVTGSIVEYSPDLSALTQDSLAQTIKDKFTGQITQYPPVYSALKMDGRPLYEYAREGIPLPRKIEPRASNVDFFDIVPGSFTHITLEEAALPKIMATEEEQAFYLRETMPPPSSDQLVTSPVPIQFVRVKFRFSVSSGTYIRSLIHDVAREMGVCAYMASLVRAQQGPFELGKNVFDLDDLTKNMKDEEWVPMVKVMLERGPDITIEEIKKMAEEDAKKKQEEQEEEIKTVVGETKDGKTEIKEIKDEKTKEIKDEKSKTEEIKDEKTETEEIKSDEKTETEEIKTDEKTETEEIKADEKPETEEIKADEKPETEEIKADEKTEAPQNNVQDKRPGEPLEEPQAKKTKP
ncbi:uncharacterized protein SAPINGB_P004748 [Magnusiomyces paraingens]|uniref:tRNA pseudouridine(55) synthase n=1 Tax=Magnusiomyces paraingens TaxID=2606893 RepID=A0A5E8C225_9ASCO|nr:uncharacterized protein SAPINGB_P004748 [Saprochaete ingens]VVT55807.1 unnamed protein product [Saprochaete ingens]